MEQQVKAEQYKFEKYCKMNRWSSYYYQVRECMELKEGNILIVGKGDGIVPNIVKHINDNVRVDTFDFAEDLNPTILGDLTKIDEYVDAYTYDVVVCCEVLEHLPFSAFEEVIKKLSLISKWRTIISIPQRHIEIGGTISLPKVRLKKYVYIEKFWEKEFKFNGEHYWELKTKGCSVKRVRNILNQYYQIVNEYTVVENSYHRFWILDKV